MTVAIAVVAFTPAVGCSNRDAALRASCVRASATSAAVDVKKAHFTRLGMF